MGWEKQPIDKMEMLHLLGIIYAQTATGFGKVALREIIMTNAKPTVRGKVNCIIKALTRSGLLLYQGCAKYRTYKWNLQEFGPVSIPIARAMISETERQRRLRDAEKREHRRRKKLENLAEND